MRRRFSSLGPHKAPSDSSGTLMRWLEGTADDAAADSGTPGNPGKSFLLGFGGAAR
jgi:hypothetical protein